MDDLPFLQQVRHSPAASLCSQIPLLETSTTALKVLLLVYFLKHNKILKGGHAAQSLPAQVNRSLQKAARLAVFCLVYIFQKDNY